MLLVMMLFSMIGGVAAQTSANVEVSDPQFVWDVNRKFNFQRANSSNPRAPLSPDPVQEISASFRNTGTKTIKKISWEFITHKADAPTKIEYVHTVNSKREIAPGETVRLSKTGIFWGRSVNLEARVFRIEYADGTVWEDARTKN
jgi:hypothetical protein